MRSRSREIVSEESIECTDEEEQRAHVSMDAAEDCGQMGPFVEHMVAVTEAELRQCGDEEDDAEDLVRVVDVLGLCNRYD